MASQSLEGLQLQPNWNAVKYLSPATNLAIIRCSRSTENLVRAALTFIRQIKGTDCCIRVLHISGRSFLPFSTFINQGSFYTLFTGTIRKTQQAAIMHDRSLIMASLSKNTNHGKLDLLGLLPLTCVRQHDGQTGRNTKNNDEPD